METLSGVIFSPIIVNWLSVFVVVEENALYVYANETSLIPSQVVRVESMYVEQVSRRESGRDFCFIVSNAANLYVFSAKNEALQKVWIEKLSHLRVLRQHVLIMESQDLLRSHESVVNLSGYVYYHENLSKSKWGRRFLELRGLNLCVYADTKSGRSIRRRMNLTCAILSVSSIDSKLNLANSPRKIRDKDKWPTEHFLHVRVSAFHISGLATKQVEESAETNLDLVDIFICTFTEEDKMNWEAAFRVVGRGGMSPLAGCNIVADVSRADIVEGTPGDRHVMYTINVSTNSLRSASKSKGSIHGDVHSINNKKLDQLILSNETIDVTSMPPATWKVRRRYSQFLNLHNQLSVHFAAFAPQDVPKFPGKTYHRRRSFTSTHIGTRLEELRQYFVSILQFRIIRESSPLHRFL